MVGMVEMQKNRPGCVHGIFRVTIEVWESLLEIATGPIRFEGSAAGCQLCGPGSRLFACRPE
jgi:hypothetical protein